MVDCCRGGICKFSRELVQTHVVRMHERIHIAKCEQVMLGVEPENFEHRLRPENASSCEVPIPKPATTSVQCSIDATADCFIDQIRLPSPGCLPMESKTENKHDKPGGGRQCNGKRCERAPTGKCHLARLDDRELAEGSLKHAYRRQRACIVGEGDFHNACSRAESRQWLRWSKHVHEAPTDRSIGRRHRGRNSPVWIG